MRPTDKNARLRDGCRRHGRRAAICLLACLISIGASAQDGRDAFKAGVEAARAGDHDAALEYFVGAQQEGMDGDALYFNLGVTHYRLGRLDAAEAAFIHLTASDEMAAPAYYNLGLIADDRGDTGQAVQYFRRAAALAKTDKLRRLSRLAAGRLQPSAQPVSSRPGAGLWMELGAGYDDNALLVPNESAAGSGEGDALGRISAYGYTWLTGDGDNGLRLEGYVQSERYDELNEFDLDVYQVRSEYRFGGGSWRHAVGVALRHFNLDGGDFQDSYLLDAASSRPLSANTDLEMELEYESIDTEPAFSYLDGERYAFAIGVKHSDRGVWHALYGYGHGDREDLVYADGTFRSFSPATHSVSLGYRTPVAGRLTLSAEFGYSRSRYADAEVFADGSAFKREDDAAEGSVTLEHPLGGGWQSALTLIYRDNDSNLGEYAYERRVVMFSVDRSFDIR